MLVQAQHKVCVPWITVVILFIVMHAMKPCSLRLNTSLNSVDRPRSFDNVVTGHNVWIVTRLVSRPPNRLSPSQVLPGRIVHERS